MLYLYDSCELIGRSARQQCRSTYGHRPAPHPTIRLLVLFLLAVGVRLLYIHSTPPESPIGSIDAWGYHRLARNLDRGNGFSLRRHAPFLPDSVRTPLYPAFVLLIRRTLGSSPRSTVVVQACLDGLTMLGVYALATQTLDALGRTSLAGRRAGSLAALLYALDPVQVRYVNELLAETLLSFSLTCGLCTLVRCIRLETCTPSSTQTRVTTRQALLLGILAGISALCKPNVQLLPLIWLPCLLLAPRQDSGECAQKRVGSPSAWHAFGWRTFHWRNTALAALAFLTTLAPWLIRNALVFGRPFLSTAFEGNISRVSAPATLITARDQYAIPWSAEWEAAFGELVSQAARRYGWDRPWESLRARELDVANRQVYWIAREVLRQHPLAWLKSHTLGIVRYVEPQSYRILYARFTGQPWPPDNLEDAIIHAIRQIARGDQRAVGQIIGQERWSKLTPFQRCLWWGTVLAQILGLVLVLRGAWTLRTRPVLAAGLLGTLACILWLPGPIAYERFRVPVWGLIAVLVAVAAVRRPADRDAVTVQRERPREGGSQRRESRPQSETCP